MSITRWIEMGAAAPAAVAAGLILCAGYQWWKRSRVKDPRLCPGAAPRRWEWLRPGAWLTRRACGYDLSGLPRDRGGVCTCPECGSRIGASTARARTVVRWRLIPMGLMLLALSATMWNVRWLRRGGWVQYTPTTVLIGLERAIPSFVHAEVRWRLDSRLEKGGMWEIQKGWLIAPAVHALGADRVSWNADWGRGVLRRIGDRAIPALEAALRSEDYQRRQIAADLLRDRADPDPALRWRWQQAAAEERYEPTDDLLRVTVEGLQDDRLSLPCCLNNAYGGFEFLRRYPLRIEPFVRAGLRGTDGQQRWLCATLADVCGLTALADDFVPALVEQLAADELEENAIAATTLLVRMGWPAVKHLQRVADSADPQQRRIAGLILLEIATATDFTDDVERRCELLREFRPLPEFTRNPIRIQLSSDSLASR